MEADVSNSNRINSFDFLRSVMMCLGIVLHAAQLYLVIPIVDYYWDTSRSYSMDALLIFINTFRMPVFYMISGFFTALLFYKYGIKGMLANRLKRILLPFVLFLPPLALIMTALKVLAFNLMESGSLGFNLEYIDGIAHLWDNTHNLWFLYYLTLFVMTSWIVLTLSGIGIETVKSRLFGSDINVFSIKVIVIMTLLLGAVGSFNDSGRVSASLSFVPSLKTYLYFLICYLFGHVLFVGRERLAAMKNKSWLLLAVAMVFLILGLVGFVMQGKPVDQNYALFHGLLSVSTGAAVTFFMLGFVATFQRYFSHYKANIKYLSDASYWIFIFHSIPLVVIGLCLSQWQVVAEVKFLIVCVSTFALCLVTYHYWVRGTWIGVVLNGKRL